MVFAQLFFGFFRLDCLPSAGIRHAVIDPEGIGRFGWMTPEEFIDMIAIAEMTPGTIGVNAATFVGV